MNASGSLYAQSPSHPVSELPYNKVIHWLYGVAWLILQSQDAFSIQWALLIPSILQKPLL